MRHTLLFNRNISKHDLAVFENLMGEQTATFKVLSKRLGPNNTILLKGCEITSNADHRFKPKRQPFDEDGHWQRILKICKESGFIVPITEEDFAKGLEEAGQSHPQPTQNGKN